MGSEGGFLRQNWHLLAIIVLAVAGAVGYGLLGGGGSEGELEAVAYPEGETPRAPQYANEPRPTPADEAKEVIEGYETRLSENPEDPDAPALLFAAGNLYRQKLQDYESAADKYQVLLIEHPDWEGIENVFPQLEVCFEKTNDEDGLKWLYEYMLDKMPVDSQHYLYAKQKLDS